MSTLSTTNLKNPSSGSNNIVLGADGATTLGTTKVTAITDSAGSNSSTPAAIANGTAKAWVNFNGTGTVAIRASFNVSSITDNGTGSYTVNFTTALSDANYCSVLTTSADGVAASYVYEANSGANRSSATTTTLLIQVVNNSAAAADRASISVAIFR